MKMKDFVRGMEDISISNYIDKKHMKDVLRDSYRKISKKRNTKGALNLLIVMEEFGELIQEVSKFMRGEDNHMELMEELADACICIEYIKDLCGISDVELNKAINVKLKRQQMRNKKRMLKKERNRNMIKAL